ncbi:BNR-4 repeat-containing protein [Kordia jejudonensis]|uniref:BNR-4 repeat-containing protein n=1 Tax=Kordia jejudonensis TaxID=1348245 RepID=UPI000629390B|nr:BNR-4 repeat-containing protein [Kordia jejudonensis]
MQAFRHFLLFFFLLGAKGFAQHQASHTVEISEAVSSENYQSMTSNGVWSWFSDPRAVYYEGKYKRTYAGWIDNYGDVHIGFYDHDTKKVASTVIYDNLEIDDHDNPSILFDDDGRLLVFFNTHLQDDRPLFMRTSTNPEDIRDWSPIKELYLNDTEKYRNSTINRHTYTNPVRLSKENGKLYIFWRGIDLKPSYSVSTDNGKTWSKGTILFIPDETETLKSPYTKVYSDGNSKIHFTFTDGHPTKEKKNGLYYMYYENGAFYKANGTKIKTISQLPILQEELDVIFESDTVKSWNWDIAEDANGSPIVTYVKFPKKDQHVYSYATFATNEWKSYDLTEVNGWFPETRPNIAEPEPHYAGGIVIDHENPNTVYLSVKRNGIFEIEQWTSQNKGKSWNVKEITKNSTKNNVRPVAVRGAQQGNPLQVLWLQNTKYIYYAHDTRGKTISLPFKNRYHTAVKMNLQKSALRIAVTKQNLEKLLRNVAERLLENPDHSLDVNGFRYGIACAGLEAFYKVCKEARYKNELLNIKQYQTEEDEDEDEENFYTLDIVWSYSSKNNREYLQKIEKVTSKELSEFRVDLQCASMIYLLRNFEENILDSKRLKNEFSKISTTILAELNAEAFHKRFTTGKVLLIYSLAAGINDGLLDKKHTEIVVSAWKDIQKEILPESTIINLNTETKAAILLAGKEIYQILNAKH